MILVAIQVKACKGDGGDEEVQRLKLRLQAVLEESAALRLQCCKKQALSTQAGSLPESAIQGLAKASYTAKDIAASITKKLQTAIMVTIICIACLHVIQH